MRFRPLNLAPITKMVLPDWNGVGINVLDILSYNYNVSSLIKEDYHYYYVDNLRLYKFDWITKTLIYIRFIPTSYGGEYPTLYQTSDDSLYGYSNVGSEYNCFLYREDLVISFFEQDTMLDIPSSKIILFQDLETSISAPYSVDIDITAHLKIYSDQDMNINVIKSNFISYQDTFLSLSFEIFFDTSCVIDLLNIYNAMQDTECFIDGLCVQNLTFTDKKFTFSILGIRSDGILVGAGLRNHFDLGYHDLSYYYYGLNKFTASYSKFKNPQLVAGGYRFTFVVDESGSLWGFGDNGYGELGLGDSSNFMFPVKYDSSFDNPLIIACGVSHSVIVKSNGTVWVTGSNDSGQLGIVESITNTFTQLSTDFNNPQKVVCGSYHTFIVRQDGTVWAAGENANGRLGLGDTVARYQFTQLPTGFNNPILISTYYNHTFIVKSDGTVWAVGSNYTGQLGLGDTTQRLTFTQLPTTFNNPLSISCGSSHTLLLKSDNTLWGTGNNYYGQLGLGGGTSVLSFTLITNNVTAIFANTSDSYIIQNNNLFVAGQNYYGELGLGDNTWKYSFTQVPCVTLVPVTLNFYQDTSIDLTFSIGISFDTQLFIKNYSMQDTSLNIPSSTIVNDIDTFVTITAPMENHQDTSAICQIPVSSEFDTYLYSFFDNSIKHDTSLDIKRIYIANCVLRNNFYVESNLVIINSIIVATIFYILNNFNDKKEKKYELLNKFLLNDPMDIVVYLINSLTLSKNYVFSNSILDKYEKSIHLLNEIMVNLEQNCIINNNILDKFDNVCILLNEIKDSYELPFVLKNRLNDNVVKYLLINNNLEKYLNKEITLQNILEEAVLGVVNQTYYDVFVSE